MRCFSVRSPGNWSLTLFRYFHSKNTKADLLRFVKDGPVNSFQYWCIDFLKKRKSLELKIEELGKQTEYYKGEFRQYCNKYVSHRQHHGNEVAPIHSDFRFISEREAIVAPKADPVDLVSHRTE